MRAWLSLSLFSEADSASSSAASWRRSAAICWFKMSTCEAARADSSFSLASAAPADAAAPPAPAASLLLVSISP